MVRIVTSDTTSRNIRLGTHACKQAWQIVCYTAMLPLPPAEIRHTSRMSRFGATETGGESPTTDRQICAHRSGNRTIWWWRQTNTSPPYLYPYGDIISSTRLRFSRASPVGSVMPCSPCLAPWSGVYVVWHNKICRAHRARTGPGKRRGREKLTTYRVPRRVARLAS